MSSVGACIWIKSLWKIYVYVYVSIYRTRASTMVRGMLNILNSHPRKAKLSTSYRREASTGLDSVSVWHIGHLLCCFFTMVFGFPFLLDPFRPLTILCLRRGWLASFFRRGRPPCFSVMGSWLCRFSLPALIRFLNLSLHLYSSRLAAHSNERTPDNLSVCPEGSFSYRLRANG